MKSFKTISTTVPGTNAFQGIPILNKTIIYLFSKVRNWSKSYEPLHEISMNMVCATSKTSDQSAHMRSLIRAFASNLSIL